MKRYDTSDGYRNRMIAASRVLLLVALLISGVFGQSMAQVADFTNTVRILPDGSPQSVDELTIGVGQSFELIVGVDAPDGLLIGSVTATVMWDGDYFTMLNPEDATVGGVGDAWFSLGSNSPIVFEPDGDAFGEVTWAKGDLLGLSPGEGEFEFLKLTFTAISELDAITISELIHLETGSRASLITQPEVSPEETDVTGAKPSVAVEIVPNFDCPDLLANIGDPCDDGNPETNDDVITPGCLCQGQGSGDASIAGTIEWDADCGSRLMEVSFYQPGTSSLEDSFSLSIMEDGTFSLPGVPIGTFDIYFKIEGYLAEGVLSAELTGGANTLTVEAPVAGDLNGDNGVNIIDFSLLNSAFGSTLGDANFNPLADLNCDGGVNIVDFSVLNASFGLVGAQP